MRQSLAQCPGPIGHSSRRLTTSLAVAASLGASCAVSAHTRLLAPNGGESIEAGSVFEVSWSLVVPHPQNDWDLWYSTESPLGPWTIIAEDLPVGDPTPGSIHTHAWTVPDLPADSVWVRVRQDNVHLDYEDTSDEPFAIVAGACTADLDGDGLVGCSDLMALLAAWGPCSEDCAEDLDGSLDVTVADLLRLFVSWGPCA